MTKSYHGNEVIEYKQTPGKAYCLNPAFERNLPSGENKTLLDVGCGDGFYHGMCIKNGFRYSGIDISEDMIYKAQLNIPNGNFKVGSCFDITKI